MILKKKTGIADLQISFFETFDFNFDSTTININNNNNNNINNNNNEDEKEKQVEPAGGEEEGDKDNQEQKRGEDQEIEVETQRQKEQLREDQERSIFFQKTLPFMQHHALEIEKLFPPPNSSSSSSSNTTTSSPSSTIPLPSPLLVLARGGASEVTLHQNQIVCLLAHCFFNTYPK